MSITLTTPYTVAINGTQVEDDTVGACSSYSMDFLAKILTVVFKIGTLTGSPSTLNVGPYSQQPPIQTVTVAVYLGPTGGGQTQYQWWLNGVLQASIIPSATMAPFVTQLLGDRNASETFVAVSGGLMPGTQVPWTTI
jgi:hypothetical protein